METTADEELKRYSPQIGQSHSVARSTQRWESAKPIAIQTLHFCVDISISTKICMHKANLAVDIVLAEALSPPAYTTIITMVDPLTAVIIPELAYIAVIPCRLLTTVLAMFASRLWGAANHTEHVLSFSTVQVVRFYFVMAVTTSVPPTALKALDFNIALVVLATKRRPVLFCIEVFVFPINIRT